MKSTKLFVISAAMLVLAMVFVGCGDSGRTYAPDSATFVARVETEADAPATATAPTEASADASGGTDDSIESRIETHLFAGDSFEPALDFDTAYDAVAFSAGEDFGDWFEVEESFIFEAPPQTPGGIRPRLMTAGEWNDNENHDFLLSLMQTSGDFRTFQARWNFNLSRQVRAVVTEDGRAINGAQVELLDANGNVLFAAMTNNFGVAYLFVDFVPSAEGNPAHIRATSATSETQVFNATQTSYEFSLQSLPAPQGLDLMFVIDVTGSMGDELEYLKVELTDIIQQVNDTHANLDIRLSIIVYRDVCCDFVVRTSPFTRDINSQVRFLEAQYAAGGGDWEEAVEQALAEALEQEWRDNSAARLMFLVLDAPPHNRPEIRDEMHRVTTLSAEKGVRIIPVAASGIDTITEFLLRALSAATGGTYVFITGDSGIGHGHIDPTIGEHDVRLLNELLVEVINRYLE